MASVYIPVDDSESGEYPELLAWTDNDARVSFFSPTPTSPRRSKSRSPDAVAEKQANGMSDNLMHSLKNGQSQYLESLFTLVKQCKWDVDPGSTFEPLPITMYQKFMELYPHRLDNLCYHSKYAPFLGTKLIQRNYLNENEQVDFLVYTCNSPKWDINLWIPLLEVVLEPVFQKALPRIEHKIGDNTTHLYADMLNAAAEQEGRIAIERLVEAAMWHHGIESRPDEVDRGVHDINRATQVLKRFLENTEITGKMVKPAIEALMEYKPDPLKLDNKENKCAVELADERGPAFASIAVVMFHEGCSIHDHNRQEMLKFLAKRKIIGDTTLKAIVRVKKEDFLTSELITTCAGSGCIDTSCELALQYSKSFSRTHEQTFLEILIHARDGNVAVAAFTQLTPDLYSMDCVDKKGNNVLHIAGENGFAILTEQILDQGYTRLLWAKNLKGEYPVQVSLAVGKFETAAVFLRAMNDWRLCVVSKRTNCAPAVNFQRLLFELAWAKSCKKHHAFNCTRDCLARHRDEEEDEAELMSATDYHLPDSQDKKHIEDCIMAILDSTVDKQHGVIHYDVLEADKNGYTPDQDKGYRSKEPGYNPSGHNCIEIVAKQDLEEIAAHKSFHGLIKLKWQQFGWIWYLVLLTVYLLFFGLLTVALVLATDEEEPSTYDTPLAKFRLFCEVIVILGVLLDFIGEIVDFCTNYDKSFRKYLTDWTNWFDMLAISMTLLIIPFRFTNLNVQWIFAALAYIFHGLRIFEYAIILRFFGRYVEILVRVVIRDLTQFLIVFMVFMITFGGGLFFAMRGEPCPFVVSTSDVRPEFNPLVNTSLCVHPEETGSIYRIWLTGIRLLAEGENIIFPYLFQDRGFRGLAGAIYIVFLFLVVVILLNLLIAQFTKSYEEEIGRAHISVTLNRAKALSRMWNPLWMKVIIRYRDFFKRYTRVSYYRPTSHKMDLDDPDKLSKKFEEVQQTIYQTNKSVHKQLKGMQDQLDKQAVLSKTIMEQTVTAREHSQERHHSLETSLPPELKEQIRNSSMVISELQREVKEQATVIKKQATIMEELQVAVVRQTEMFSKQQQRMRETWMSELTEVLQRFSSQTN